MRRASSPTSLNWVRRPDLPLPDKREAWGHCGGIRLVTGRRKIELTGEGAGHAG